MLLAKTLSADVHGVCAVPPLYLQVPPKSAFAIGVPDVPMLEPRFSVTAPPISTGLPVIIELFFIWTQPLTLNGEGIVTVSMIVQPVASSL